MTVTPNGENWYSFLENIHNFKNTSGQGALNDESKYRPVSNIYVPIQWTKHTWSDWYLETE